MWKRPIGWALWSLLILTVGVSAQDAQQAAPEREAAPPPRRDAAEERGRPLFGKIAAIHADSLELTRPDGGTVTVKLTAQTQFRKDRETAKPADFKTGDVVFVRGEENPDHTWTAQMVGARAAGGPGAPGAPMGTLGRDFVAGEVTSLEAPKINVLRIDGVSQPIQPNEETSFRQGQESITFADLHAGDHLVARGALQGDVFVPKMLMLVSPERWKRMQEMGGFGPGRGQAPPASAIPPKPQELPR
ncbi:MAG: DUF5666 domain-containing protein [Acidobacteriia bacterium]|nr:DUF5666 domain-containing protein [Terriglobia bacterium]